ncbi:MAG: DUF3330 domain-containing protein [Candidatus Polarisedimenticolaceae bacterium]|nr:DUF3330 domain-containing protein [Candidatus Polarisedimenticolaceae bacterium]
MSDQKSTPDTEQKEKHEQEQTLDGCIPCKICLKEIPQSIARTEEGDDYVLYFCGADCFDQWEHQKSKS